jgi:tetratricopeptide (TPR) repeat protein
MEFEHLKDLYVKGKYQEFLDQLALLEKREQYSSLSTTEQVEFIYYKVRALVRTGKYEEALDTAIQSRSSIPELKDKSLILGLIIAQISPLIPLGRLQEALMLYMEGDDIYHSLTSDEQEKGVQWVAAFLHMKSIVCGRKGDFATALEYGKKCLLLRESIEDSQGIAETLRHMGGVYWTTGELNLALEHLERSLSISKAIGNSYDIARVLSHLGLVYQDRGELSYALECYEQSRKLFETIGNPLANAVCLTNIGRLYRDKGELGLALENLHQSLTVMRSIGDQERIATTLANIGSVYWKMGELNLAEEYLVNSLHVRESVGTDLYRSHHLFYLLRVALEQQNRSKAHSYLSQLEDLHERQPSDKLTHLHYRLGEALVLKTSRRFINKAQAQKILTEIVDDEMVIQYYGSLAQINLCELLLDELKAYGEVEVFEETKALVQKLYEQAQKEHSFSLEVNALILQAKFAMIEGNLVKSTRLLNQAGLTIEEKGLGSLAEKVSFENQRLEEQVDTWHYLIQTNASLQERLKQARLSEYIRTAAKLIDQQSFL